MGICDQWSIGSPGRHFKPPGLYCDSCERPQLYYEPLMLLNVDFITDSDLAFHSNADPVPDPASKNNADPDP